MATPDMTQPSLVTTGLLAVAIVFPILGTAAVALRFYFNGVVKKQSLAGDDWVCVLAQLAAWGISVDIFVAAGKAGVDTTYPDLNPLDAAVIFLRTLWIEGFPLVLSLTFVKIAILLFYRRIFVTPGFKLAVNIFIGILSAWCFATIICQLLAANPIQDAWNPLATNPLRYNYNAFSEAFAGMSIVFDVIVLLFPLPVIRTLQMTFARKVQVMALFWLGTFCCVSSAVRFYFLHSEIEQSTIDTGPGRYLKITTAFMWGTIEPNASIIAACLPCYAPLFAKGRGLGTLLANFGSLFSGSRGSGKSSRDRARGNKYSEGIPGNGSYQMVTPSGRSWEPFAGPKPGYSTDVERGESRSGDDVPLKDPHPALIKVTRDLTQTETRHSGY